MDNSFNRFLLIISLVSLLIFSCKSNSSLKNDCDENLNFKELFFYHIKNIDTRITISQDVKFRESVTFISNYAPVSVNRIMNYSRTYPYSIYQKDRELWINWYEENKCKNIQLKTSLIIPDAYQYIEE
jgi:hypothetical protein